MTSVSRARLFALLGFAFALAALGETARVEAQVIVIDAERRIIPPRPIPRPAPVPSASYKIRTVEVEASVRAAPRWKRSSFCRFPTTRRSAE
jgi:hypothetical protein